MVEIEEDAVAGRGGVGSSESGLAAQHLADVEELTAAADGALIEAAAGDTFAVDAQDGSLQGNRVRELVFWLQDA